MQPIAKGMYELMANSHTTEIPQQFSLFEFDHEPEVEEAKSSAPPAGRFSNFVVYVDESGSHGMQNIDPNYPLFVLAFWAPRRMAILPEAGRLTV